MQQWGGLLAVNYAARAFGVRRGMRVGEARAVCPGLHTPHVPVIGDAADSSSSSSSVAAAAAAAATAPPAAPSSADAEGERPPVRSLTKVSLERYRVESQRIFAVLESLAPTLERASIDEAYVDATELAVAELHGRGRRGAEQLHEWSADGAGEWVHRADDGDARWRPDPSDTFDAHLLAAGAVCARLRAAVLAATGYRMSAGIAHSKVGHAHARTWPNAHARTWSNAHAQPCRSSVAPRLCTLSPCVLHARRAPVHARASSHHARRTRVARRWWPSWPPPSTSPTNRRSCRGPR